MTDGIITQSRRCLQFWREDDQFIFVFAKFKRGYGPSCKDVQQSFGYTGPRVEPRGLNVGGDIEDG